jgi:hypothetical protein
METKDVLEKIYADLLAEEGITKEDLDFVDLEIGFSPVIPVKGGSPTEAIETIGGKYLLPNFPIFRHAISAEELKVMRYRYLSNR